MKNFLALIFCSFVASMSWAQDVSSPIDFDSQVAPILKKHCAGCHNDEEAESDFNVASVAKMLEVEMAISVGNGAASHIIELMRGTEEPIMPPEDEFERVPENEIAIVEQWINEGANPSKGGAKVALTIGSPKWKAQSKVNSAVLAADWAPDGDLIAIAQFGSVKLLDAETLKLKHEFGSLPGKVNSVQFSADGSKLIGATGIGGVGGRAVIWDADSFEQLGQFDGHSDVMYDAVISPDGTLVATSAYDKTICIWEVESGKQLRKLKGHNSAVYDLAFSPDSKNLVSASDDQTIKVWNVATGQRLDTLGQPLKEQFTTSISPNGWLIVGGGRDSRLRVWKLTSTDSPAINPILFSRFAHERSIVRLEFSMDGSLLFSAAEDKTIKVWETETFLQVGLIDSQPEICSAISVSPDAKSIFVGRLDGSMELLSVPERTNAVASAEPVAAREAHTKEVVETENVPEVEPNNDSQQAQKVALPAKVKGTIAKLESGTDADVFQFSASAGQSLMVEARAAGDKSPIDTRIEILDSDGTPVPQVVLRAVRDSYFTFRGKDSDTFDDFRVHNWQEMKLNEFIYANGEVNKLFLHPRGPDSGFRVYPGTGKRFGYFGTTAMSHALQEPCYIVEPWPPGTTFLPNGLPVFELNYENDDDSRRELGTDSRLKFVAPKDGDYLVRVTDVRGFGGDDHEYELTVRDSNPDFEIKIEGPKSIFPDSGSEYRVVAKRKDGFEGPIHVEAKNVPDGFHIVSPLTIEANHIDARGAIYALDGAKTITKEQADAVEFIATAKIAGEDVAKSFKGLGEVKIEEANPKVVFQIVRESDDELPETRNFDQPLVFEIRPGESIQAHIVSKRNGHEGPIKFGNEGSGRNLPHGVKVDDIGLNGLMIPKGQSRQRFFIKAEAFVQPQTRTFHLVVDNVNKLVGPPVILKVLPAKDDRVTRN
jgi:hypothetical protein